MKRLRGARTSKRWYLVIRIAVIIALSGWAACGILAAFYQWDLFAAVASTTIISLAGIASAYVVVEYWRPHDAYNGGDIVINQGGNQDYAELPEKNEPR